MYFVLTYTRVSAFIVFVIVELVLTFTIGKILDASKTRSRVRVMKKRVRGFWAFIILSQQLLFSFSPKIYFTVYASIFPTILPTFSWKVTDLFMIFKMRSVESGKQNFTEHLRSFYGIAVNIYKSHLLEK